MRTSDLTILTPAAAGFNPRRCVVDNFSTKSTIAGVTGCGESVFSLKSLYDNGLNMMRCHPTGARAVRAARARGSLPSTVNRRCQKRQRPPTFSRQIAAHRSRVNSGPVTASRTSSYSRASFGSAITLRPPAMVSRYPSGSVRP